MVEQQLDPSTTQSTLPNAIVLEDGIPGPSSAPPDENAEWIQAMSAVDEDADLQEQLGLQRSMINGGNDDEVDEETTWEVEEVLDKRVNPMTGYVEYLLLWSKWDGPPTWEPEENCSCKALIRKFERENKKGRPSTPKTPAKRGPKSKPPNKVRKISASSSNDTYVDAENGTAPDQDATLTPTAPPTTPKNKSIRKNLDSQLSNGSSGLRRSARCKKPPIEIITLGDSSDTASNLEANPLNTKHPSPPNNVQSPLALSSSSSSSDTAEVTRPIEFYEQKLQDRKLILENIVAALKVENEMHLLVKWRGLKELERVPLGMIRRFYCQNVLDFLLEHLKWTT